MQKLWFCVPGKLRRRATSIHCKQWGHLKPSFGSIHICFTSLVDINIHNGIVVLSPGMGANVGIMRNMMTQLLNGNRVAIHQRRITANSFAHSTMSLGDRCSAFTAGKDSTQRYARPGRHPWWVPDSCLSVCERSHAYIIRMALFCMLMWITATLNFR